MIHSIDDDIYRNHIALIFFQTNLHHAAVLRDPPYVTESKQISAEYVTLSDQISLSYTFDSAIFNSFELSTRRKRIHDKESRIISDPEIRKDESYRDYYSHIICQLYVQLL